MKLEFGNPKHIAMKNKKEFEFHYREIKNKVKCPFCGGKNKGYDDFNAQLETIDWLFDCCEKAYYETMRTDYQGKFIT